MNTHPRLAHAHERTLERLLQRRRLRQRLGRETLATTRRDFAQLDFEAIARRLEGLQQLHVRHALARFLAQLPTQTEDVVQQRLVVPLVLLVPVHLGLEQVVLKLRWRHINTFVTPMTWPS